MASTYENTFNSAFQNQSWSSYQPVGDPAAGEHEMNQQAGRKPLSSLTSLHSFTGISNTSYTGLIDGTLPNDVRRTPLGYQGLLRWWLPEILSSCISISALIALIVVLRIYNGRGLDDLRLPSWLTLNSLVAVIATINRVAMVAPVEAAMSQEVWLWFSSTRDGKKNQSRLEDLETSNEASRGAWGSFLFLWRGGGRWLSDIGAIVVIISLGFGAFTQQLIGVVTLPVSSTSISSLLPGNIPHSEMWMNSTGGAAEGGLSTTLSMKASVYNGMLEGGIAPLSASCPTGNCTFPITPTVAVCGECKKVPYTTACNSTDCQCCAQHQSRHLAPTSAGQYQLNHTSLRIGTATRPTRNSQYTLSTGTVMNLTNWLSEEVSDGINFQVAPRAYNVIGTRRLDIAAFDVFGAPYGSYSESWANSSTTSSACSLWMCVNALAITTQNGAQSQSVVSSFSETADVISETDFESGASLISFDHLPAEMNSRPGAQYFVGFLAFAALAEFVAPLASGTVLIYPGSHIPSSDTIEAIWNGTVDGLDGWIKNLALSMTNVIRTSASATAPRYNGTAYQSGIQVRWEWLALPVAMVSLSVFVLAVVIVQTSRAKVKAWKGSPLAYLMTDVDGNIKQSVGVEEVSTFRGVEKAVGRRRVVLDNQSSGRLIFREVGA